MPAGLHLFPPKKRIAAVVSFICSDHVQTMFVQSMEHRLDGVLLEPGPQARQEQPHCREGTLDADLRHWERSGREATGPHRGGVGWDDVPHIRLCKNFDGKWEGYPIIQNFQLSKFSA